MARNVEKEADKFYDGHKNETGSDAGQKIAEDLAKATEGLTEGQKQQFYERLSENSRVDKNEKAEFHMQYEDGKKHLHVDTRTVGAGILHNAAFNITDTDLTEEVEDIRKPKPASQGSYLERGTENVKKRDAYIEGKFDE